MSIIVVIPYCCCKKQVWIWDVGMSSDQDSTNPRCDSILISHSYSCKIPKKSVLQPEETWMHGSMMARSPTVEAPLSKTLNPYQLHDCCFWTWALTSMWRAFPCGHQWNCRVLSIFPTSSRKHDYTNYCLFSHDFVTRLFSCKVKDKVFWEHFKAQTSMYCIC